MTDLQVRMSKKVAQLTKVIFLLNTKNDENDNNIKQLTRTYENEMDTILKQSNEILRKYKDASEKNSNITELERSYEVFKSKVESERTKSVMEFNNYKNSFQEKEKSMQAEVEKKVNTYKMEIETMKVKFENMQRALQKLTENSEAQKNSHQKELGDYVKEQNEK